MHTNFPARVASFAVVTALIAASPALAQSSDDFFKGRTITLLIGGTAGGGLDNASRLLARHMGRHIAGNPTITAQLMPGAGGIRVLDFVVASAPKDGTTIASIPSGPLLEPLIGGRKMSYSMTDFNALGAFIKDFSLCVAWHESGFKTVDDARKAEMTVAGTGAASTTDIYPVVLNAALGTKFKVITGYLGTQETAMAIERRETHGRCGWSWSSLKGTRPEWLRDKKLNMLLQMGSAKSPEFPDVPFVLDLAQLDGGAPDAGAAVRAARPQPRLPRPAWRPAGPACRVAQSFRGDARRQGGARGGRQAARRGAEPDVGRGHAEADRHDVCDAGSRGRAPARYPGEEVSRHLEREQD